MLMEAMRLSLLDQQQQRNGNRASSSTSAPSSQPPVLNQRPITPSQPVEGEPVSGDSERSGTPERTPRRTPSGAIAGPLVNSANAIAVSVGLPSSFPVTPPQPSLSAVPTQVSRVSPSSSSGSSTFTGLRGRLTFGKNNDASRSSEGGGESSASGTGKHRRAESNPPPVTTVNGLLGAHGTATAFLQAPNASSSQQARSAPVSPRAPYVGLPPEHEGVPSPVLEVPTESSEAGVPAPAPVAGETPGSLSTTPASAVPPPAPIPVPEPVDHPLATSN